MKSGNLNFLEPSGPLQACNGTALPLLFWDVMPCSPLQINQHWIRKKESKKKRKEKRKRKRKKNTFHLHGKSKSCNKSRVDDANLQNAAVETSILKAEKKETSTLLP